MTQERVARLSITLLEMFYQVLVVNKHLLGSQPPQNSGLRSETQASGLPARALPLTVLPSTCHHSCHRPFPSSPYAAIPFPQARLLLFLGHTLCSYLLSLPPASLFFFPLWVAPSPLGHIVRFPDSPPKADCPPHRPHCPPLSGGLLGPLRPCCPPTFAPLPFPGLLLFFALRRAAHLGSQASEPQLWIIGAWRCGPAPLGWPPQGPIIAIRAELSFGPTCQPARLRSREGGAWRLS